MKLLYNKNEIFIKICILILTLVVLYIILTNHNFIILYEQMYYKIPKMAIYQINKYYNDLYILSKKINKEYKNILIVGACFPRTYIAVRKIYKNSHITLIDMDKCRLDESISYLNKYNYPTYKTTFKVEKCCNKYYNYDLMILPLDFNHDYFCYSDIIKQEYFYNAYINKPDYKKNSIIFTYLSYYSKKSCINTFK
jgi:hypothetical protein